jgi:hypothetical protein
MSNSIDQSISDLINGMRDKKTKFVVLFDLIILVLGDNINLDFSPFSNDFLGKFS